MAEAKKGIDELVAELKEVKIGDIMSEDEIKAYIKVVKKYDDLTATAAMKLLANKLVNGEVEFKKSWS